MIPITYIRRNLSAIGSNYKSSKKPLATLLYAKLAIMEVGGWVEMSMDDLVYRAGARLTNADNITYLEKRVVERTWGFDYEKNFRAMLIQTVGLVSMEKIEKSVHAGKHAKMIASLKLLKSARNSVAHTYIKDIAPTPAIPAPSTSLSYLNDVLDGLKEIEAAMKKLKFI